MSEMSRRMVLAGTAGLLGSGLTNATAAEPDPLSIGKVVRDRVVLPPLHADTEVNAPTPNVDPFPRRLGVAVVGLGHLALEEILPAFGRSRSVRVTALVSGHNDKARAVAAQYGVQEKNLYDYGSFDAMRNNPEIDIVYVVLPNAMHLEFVCRAARAGKHVLCEKPMAVSSAEAELMIKACAAAKVKLMIAYRMQYDLVHRAAIEMLRSRELGELRMIQAVNGQNDVPGQWRQVKAMAGGGSLPDVGIYCLNAFRYLTGEEPVEVTGRVTRPGDDPRFREVEDVAIFSLLFPSGVLGVGASGYSIHEQRGMRAMATAGAIQFENAFAYANGSMTIARKAGQVEGLERRGYSPKSQFAAEMDHFAEAIRADAVPHTPGEEGLQDIRIMEAIYQAAETGGVVRLPRLDGLDRTRGPAPQSL